MMKQEEGVGGNVTERNGCSSNSTGANIHVRRTSRRRLAAASPRVAALSRPMLMLTLQVKLAALVLVAAAACMLRVVEGVVVGASVIPHGDFAYDPSLVHNANGSLEVHRASLEAGAFIASLAPDIVLVSSPHGVELSADFAFYANSLGDGFASIGGDLHNKTFPTYKVPLNVTLAGELASELVDELRAQGTHASAIRSFADSEPQAIRWGEVIPLTFVWRALQLQHEQRRQRQDVAGHAHDERDDRADLPSVIVLSQPLRRYNHSREMVPELLTLGEQLFDLLERRPERVAVVMSSDLAHTHLASGPYGYSPEAEPFDVLCGRWAADPEQHASALLREAAAIEADAMSCGFPSLVTLHGMLERAGFGHFRSEVLANRHPTYYGMLVANYYRTFTDRRKP